MSRKYSNDEQRYQAIREYQHKHYLKIKDTEKYKETMKKIQKKYYENNREKCNEKRAINRKKAREKNLNKKMGIECK